MSNDVTLDVSALAINITIPEALRWTDIRRGEVFTLTTLNVRLLPDGHLAAKAYGRPIGGGRGTYVSFPVPNRPELAALIAEAASRARGDVDRPSRSRRSVISSIPGEAYQGSDQGLYRRLGPVEATR
jgi:hypothetical protein